MLFKLLLPIFTLIGFTKPQIGLDYQTPAKKYGISAKLLEAVCRYESDHGRVLKYKNKNGTWDVGFCMNHRGKSKFAPKIPSPQASIEEAAKELAYWKKHHTKYCVHLLENKGVCGTVKHGKWRGINNCRKPHHWFHHYNSGFRVLRNYYGSKVYCLSKNGFKKCQVAEWKRLRKDTFDI